MFIIYTNNCFFSVNFLLNSGFALNNTNNNNYLMSSPDWKLNTTTSPPLLWINKCFGEVITVVLV